MGQGHFNAIGFGCLKPESLEKHLADDFARGGTLGDDLYDLASKYGGHTGYESKTPYIAIFLADSGLDHTTMSPTRTLADFVDFAKALAKPAVVAKWGRLRKEAKRKFGVSLPPGRLLFIADYD